MLLHERGRTSVEREGEGCGREGILLVRVREGFGYEQRKRSYRSGGRNILLQGKGSNFATRTCYKVDYACHL